MQLPSSSEKFYSPLRVFEECEALQSLLTFEVLRRSTAPVAAMEFSVMLLSFLLVSPSWSRGAVITGVSEKFVAHILNLKHVLNLI